MLRSVGLVVLAFFAFVPADVAAEAPGILLSRQLAEQAGVHVGDTVTVAVDAEGTRTAEFHVVGVYEPTPNPMRFSVRRLEARLHLPDLMALSVDPDDPLSPETVTKLNVSLVDPRDASKFAATVMTRSLGLNARPTSSGTDEGEVFAVINRFHWAIAIVTVVGSTAFLLALMIIRAEERRDIVGILRLMGIPPRSILVEVLLEGLLIAIAGAVFGILVALSAQGVVNGFFQRRYDTPLLFVHVTFRIVCESLAFAVPLGVVAGLVASWTLLRRDVMSLLGR